MGINTYSRHNHKARSFILLKVILIIWPLIQRIMNRFYSAVATSVVIFSSFGVSPVLSQVVNFSYTGKVQTYLVPKDVTSIYVDLQGAPGGEALNSRGGYGGRVQCQL